MTAEVQVRPGVDAATSLFASVATDTEAAQGGIKMWNKNKDG